jgi:hypothetical protein
MQSSDKNQVKKIIRLFFNIKIIQIHLPKARKSIDKYDFTPPFTTHRPLVPHDHIISKDVSR